MKYSQVTIKDIARELGISPSTVSRALKDHPDISRETKRAVNELAERLNYQPNVVALSLRSRKTRTIGVVIPEVVHFFFSTVISGIEHEANAAGYSVILTQSVESLEREKAALRTLFNSRVDGYLISISRETSQFDHILPILEKGLPLVFFDRRYPPGNANMVLVDDYHGARQAVRHLIDQGCRRIAHIYAAPALDLSQQRLQGYRDALAEKGLPVSEDLQLSCDEGTIAAGVQAAEKLFSSSQPPDGIFTNNDVLAIGACQVIKSLGLKIPEDIAVVGFSNWIYSQMTDPPLSSVDQPGFEMGREAARMLLRLIHHDPDLPPLDPESRVLQTSLVIRKSSARR